MLLKLSERRIRKKPVCLVGAIAIVVASIGSLSYFGMMRHDRVESFTELTILGGEARADQQLVRFQFTVPTDKWWQTKSLAAFRGWIPPERAVYALSQPVLSDPDQGGRSMTGEAEVE
jgi:hypothetical protein